jgi:PAS domain S-box-containing protein
MEQVGKNGLEGDLAAKVQALEAFARRASVLQRLMAGLAAATAVEDVGRAASEHGLELFGAAATLLYLYDPTGKQLELVAFGGAGPERVEPWRTMRIDDPRPLAAAVVSGQPVWVGSREQLVAEWPALAGVAHDGQPLCGIVALPMRDSRAVIGGLAFSFYTPPELDPVQRDFFLTVASQCGLAIERARSLASERAAHDAELRANDRLLVQQQRLALVADATELLTSELDSRKALAELARAVVPALGDWCSIEERGPDGQINRLALYHRDPAKLELAERLNAEYPAPPDDTRDIGKVLRTGETEWLPRIPQAMLEAAARDATHLALLRGLDLTGYAIVAIRARGRVLGALSLVTEGGRTLDEADVRVAEDLARRAGLALENARLFEAVASSRQHLHDLLMRVPASIAILRGPELRYELLNEDGANLIGRSDVVGLPMREVFPNLVGTGFFEILDAVYQTGKPYFASEAPIRLGVIPGDRYFNVVYQPTRDADGAVDGLITFAFEVTDQVLARRRIEALAADVAQSEARMRALVDAAATIVWTANADGDRLESSPSWLAFTGQTADDYRDGGYATAIHPDDRATALEIWQSAVAVGAAYAAEYRLRRPDGSYAHTLARGMPVRDEGGRVLEYVGCNVDVSDLRRAEAIAREQADVQAALNDLAHVIAAELDLDKVVQAVTDVATRLTRAQFGAFFYNVRDDAGGSYSLYKISGVPRERFEGFPMPRNTAIFAPTFEGDEVVRSPDITADPRYGRNAPYHGMPEGHLPVRSYLAVPVVSRSRDVIGGLFFGHSDVGVFDERAEALAIRIAEKAALAMDNARLHADAQRLIKSLETSNRELDQFAYVASHDLKAPLRGIGSLAEWIEEDLGPALTDDARTKMGLLRRRVQRMEALIQGILDFSRVGRTAGKREEIAVRKLLTDVVDLVSPQPPQAIVIGPDMPVLLSERIALQQVFLNLITNSLKHAGRPDARVEVTVRDAGERWEFRVADNGPGIAPEFHERVWGIFQTLQARDKVESTGIGLAIVKKVVEARGGRAWVESTEGEGATFCFTWPKREDRRA